MLPKLEIISISNYKSLEKVNVPLEQFTVLVGPNGTGKSNFIDTLSFVQQCLSQSIELAFNSRGGIAAVRRRSSGHPTHIKIVMVLSLREEADTVYGFEIAAKSREKFRVAWEKCLTSRYQKIPPVFIARNGAFTRKIPGIMPKIAPDRLALFAASATDDFRPVYDFLTSMRFYSIAPEKLRDLQDPDPGEYLKRDGSNAASVLKSMLAGKKGKERYDLICSLLSRVSEGVSKVEYRSAGNKETLLFRKDVGTINPWRFDTLNMSDGTLRVLGLLLAVYQAGNPSVIGIEEPESTIHPGIMELVVQVLMDAAKERQILITTHSPDILDQKELSDKNIRVVSMERGRTIISGVSRSGREAIREKLYTPGELLRINELDPEPSQTD